jgi:membrane protein
MKYLRRFLQFIKSEVWLIETSQSHPVFGFLIRQLRIIIIAVRGFRDHRIQLRASALTYYSLLSIVPVAAMVFGIAKGFGFDKRLENELNKMIAEQEEMAEVLNYVLEFANSMLDNINGGIIAGIGLVFLFWSVMKLLGNIENSFNVIWQIRRPRGFARKFADYLSMMLIAPILFFLSSTITVYLGNIAGSESVIGDNLGPLLMVIVKLMPYLLILLLFTLLYVIMPNTKVQFKYALNAGLIAGIIFQLTQFVYIYFQVGVGRFGAIYGSFVALPLFLIWLQISWLIVLLGAEMSFAYQNLEKYEFESEVFSISPKNRRLLTFLLMHTIVKKFQTGEKPNTAAELSHELGIPVRMVREIVYDLIEANLLVEATTQSVRENAYLPAIDINLINVGLLYERLEMSGDDRVIAEQTKNLKVFAGIQKSLYDAIYKSPANKLLKDV